MKADYVEAMKMALEFIEQVDSPYDDRPVITALREALAEQPAQQEPLFWYRPCSNGMYEGPIHNAQIERVRKESGAWFPLYTSPPAQQEPVFAIRLLTNQCFALIQERDELQKQVWRYEKNGVTCQTYRHKVDASCAECNVHEVYTSPPAQQQEPVAWRNAALRVGEDLCSVGPFGYYDMTAEQWLDWALSVVTVHAPPAQQEPVVYDKTEINCFAQDLYDQKMREGKRGHYESMFHVIHQCIKKVSPTAQQEPVANNKFTRAWLRLDELPGTMMQGPEGLFGPIPGSTSTWVTTSERERDQQISNGNPMLEVYTSPPAQRKPLTLEEIDLLINGRGEPDDDDYVEPIGDGFGLSDADLVRLVRKTEAAHNIKENT